MGSVERDGVKELMDYIKNKTDFYTAPAELMSSFSLVFYQSAEDAVFKALGVE